jgi:hypothetical protein
VNRCVVVPAAAASASSIHGTLHDANGRPWPAGPAREPPSTGARTVASTPRVDDQTGGSVDPNREYTQLMAQGKKLEEEVATRGQGGPEGRDRPEGLTHRL